MRPAKRLRVLVSLTLAWGAVVLTFCPGVAWPQTTEPTTVPTAAVEEVPSTVVSHPTAPAAAEPEKGGKGWCDNAAGALFCAGGKVVGKLAEGDLPGAVGTAVSGVAAPVADAAVQVVQEGFAESISHWVADGATFFMNKVGAVIDSTTTPQLRAEWFQANYQPMLALAGLLVIPLMLMSIIGAVIHNDGGRLMRMLAGHLPMAILLAAAGVTFVTVGLAITDEISGAIGHGAGANAGEALARAVAALRMVDGTGGLFALFAGALMLIVGTVAVWFELILRSAAIYVAVLFLPIALDGLVWPATQHWARRLTHLLIAVIFSKVVIVAILALAASGLAADTSSDGYAPVMAGAALFGLAALSPLVLLKLVPVLESGATSMAAAGRSPTPASTARSAGGTLFDQTRQRLARERSGAPNPMASLYRAPYKPKTGASGGMPADGTRTAAAAGTAGAGVAGLAAGQAAARRARQSAEGLPHIGAGTDPRSGNGSRPAGRAPSGGPPPPPAPPERRFDDHDGNGDHGHGHHDDEQR